jgi:adenylate kinase family enzyme
MTRSRRTLFGVVLQHAMKRVAVFGNAGGGKSTLARQLAEITRLPLYVVDKLQFKEGGAAVPHDEYLELHRDLLAQEIWIIDGYGDNTTVWERFGAADTLIYVDLTLPIHYWRVTKRLIKVSLLIRKAGRRTARFGAARCQATRSYRAAIDT